MNRPTTLVRRGTAALVLGLATMLTASCGGSTTPTDSQETPAAQFDQSLHDRLPAAVRDRGVLRVGTDASYAPMSSFGADGRTIVGMEPDLGVEIGRVLGVRLEFVNTDFTDLLSDVAAGDLDLGMSAMTDTPQRAKTADFINYFSAGTSIVVQRGNPGGSPAATARMIAVDCA